MNLLKVHKNDNRLTVSTSMELKTKMRLDKGILVIVMNGQHIKFLGLKRINGSQKKSLNDR